MPEDAPTTASTSWVTKNAPVGELGLAMSFSEAGAGARLGGSSHGSSVGCGDGVASWMRHNGSNKGYVGVGNATRSPASTKARKHRSMSSSPPLPTVTCAGSSPNRRAMASRADAAVGLGYSRSESLAASLIASITRGDGGSGDSLVLSLTQPSPSAGCSPGVYGWKPSRDFLTTLFGIREEKSPEPDVG